MCAFSAAQPASGGVLVAAGSVLVWSMWMLVGTFAGGFSDATIVLTADHGDCWGEDGLWEHGISHRRTLEVPLLMRVRCASLA